MASVFNKRIFGTDLNPDIKNKLRARQIFAEKSQPNKSIEFEDIDGHQVNLFEALGGVNFPVGNKEGSLLDLSSRTPFVRMWTAVELFLHIEPLYGEDHGKTIEDVDPTTMNPTLFNTPQLDPLNQPKLNQQMYNMNHTIQDVQRDEEINKLERKLY